MNRAQTSRLLSIGEFSAATQLSPKALRLYDEERLLRPAVVDAGNGYRYYGTDQIPLGRLIRTLRDIDLPLAQIGDIVTAEGAHAEALLCECAREGERRFARQKQAFQAALALLRRGAPASAPAIVQRLRPTVVVAVRPFLAERRFLVARFRRESASRNALGASGLKATGEPFCVLVDPLSDDEGRFEVAVPVAAPTRMPHGVTLRQLPQAPCALFAVHVVDAFAPDLTGALDALFDWFDRHGHRPIEPPTLSFTETGGGLRADVCWAYEPMAAPSHPKD